MIIDGGIMNKKFNKRSIVRNGLYFLDFVILNIVYSLSLYYLKRDFDYHEIVTLIMVVAITFFSFRLYNMYQELEHIRYRKLLVKSFIANGVSALFAGLVFLLRQDYGEKMVIRVFLITFIITTLTRFFAKQYISFKYKKANVLIIGYENDIKDIIKKFFIKYHLTYNISYISPENIEAESFENIDEVLVSQNILPKKKEEIVTYILTNNLSYKIIPGNYEIVVATANDGQIYDSFIFYKMSSSRFAYKFIKRFIDIIGSLTLLAISWPFMVLASLALKIESPNAPIFYTQPRVTINERLFDVFKFRSMIVNAEEESGAILAKKNDDRITRVGGILRKFRIDELPQLINVLKGDMSLVGPRPERPEFTSEYEKKIQLYSYRHRVKAGLTGLAQISGYYSTTIEDKTKHDLFYVEKHSIMLDIKIILLTIEVMLNPSKAEGQGDFATLEEILDKYRHKIEKVDNVYRITRIGTKSKN